MLGSPGQNRVGFPAIEQVSPDHRRVLWGKGGYHRANEGSPVHIKGMVPQDRAWFPKALQGSPGYNRVRFHKIEDDSLKQCMVLQEHAAFPKSEQGMVC